MLLGDVHGGALAHHDADRKEHRGEHGEQHHQTMAYQSVELLSGHGHHTEQEQHIRRRRPPSAGRSQHGFEPDRVGIDRHMNLRRLVLLVGAVALIVGVIGLLVPVSVPGPDNGSIGCGNGLVQDLSAAQEADNKNPANLPILNEVIPHTNYVTQCQSAVSSRRAWTIPVAVVGLVVIAGSFFVGGRAGRADAVAASWLRARQPGAGAAAGVRRRQAGR